jgi:hypothetical protein
MAYRLFVTVCAIALALVFAVNCGNNKKTIDAPPSGGSDAGIDSPRGSGTPDAAIDARGGGSGLTCGSATCPAGDTCCVGSGSSSCIGSGTTCTGLTFACDGPGDCGSGQDCCYTPQTMGTTCETGNTCAIKACNGSADCGAPQSLCCPLGSSGFSACFAHCP